MPSVQSINFSSLDYDSYSDEFEEAQDMCSFQYDDLDEDFILE